MKRYPFIVFCWLLFWCFFSSARAQPERLGCLPLGNPTFWGLDMLD